MEPRPTSNSPCSTNRVMLVLSMSWSLLVSSPPWRRSGPTPRLKGSSSAAAPKFVMGVNHEKSDNSLKIVSNTSCTTNCLPTTPATVIHDNSGIMEGLMTTAHAITVTQKIIPLESCGVLAVGLPRTSSLHPRLWARSSQTRTGSSLPSVSVVDLTCRLEKPAKYDDIKKVVKQASEDPLKGILGYTENQVTLTIMEEA
nr:glyceraldehyde-3-phosphate dehydrogenase-like [Rattus norvegicus]